MAVVSEKSQNITGIQRVNVWDNPWLNTKFLIGGTMIILVILFGLLGPFFWDTELAYVASSPTNLPPMWQEKGTPEHPLGTESNGRDMLAYFGGRRTLTSIAEAPMRVADLLGRFDVEANVRGGGLSGQAGAIRLGIARALVIYDESLRPVLRAAGMLTRDPRMVERKKYGMAGARKRYQFSKR